MKIRDLVKNISGVFINLPDMNLDIKSFKLDSREVSSSDAFICVNSGYLYIDDAIKRNASLIITDKDIKIKTNTCILKVFDIEKTILEIVKLIRCEYSYIPLIAITGSIGKTTTKELLVHTLKDKYHILYNEENKNNYLGIANTIFKLNHNYDLIILEVGMNHFNEISVISKAIMPKFGIITNIGSSHIGNLGSLKNILKAKLEITDGMNEHSSLIIPYKDHFLKNIKYPNINKCMDIKIKNIKLRDKLTFKLKYHKHNYDVNFVIPNKGYIKNIMLVFEVATYFIKDDVIIDKINSFNFLPSRMNIIDKNYHIIDDTYNSSFESVKEAIRFIKKKKKKLVILGDIKELGIYSIKIHKKINRLLYGIGKENILLVGNDTKYIRGIHFTKNDDLINYLSKLNLDDYYILVKGSRLMHMEDIVNFLKK